MAELRARKIFQFHLAHWASNPQVLLAWALPRLPKFSNSLLIHENKNGSQTTGTPILTVVLLVLITFMFTYFLVPVLHAGYLRYDAALSQFVQFISLNVHLHL